MIPRWSLPQGFQAAGVNSGVRRYRPDLGLVLSEKPCAYAGVFTKNSLKAAPVLYCSSLLSSSSIRALVVNSGQANAGTGSEGQEDNALWAEFVAQALGVQAQEVLVASTGVIGVRLPLEKLKTGIAPAIKTFSDHINAFALAIMTTDLVPKAKSKEIVLSSGVVRLTGAAKGSGMIHPNMATMLGFLLTDLQIDAADFQSLLAEAVDESFNMISVDGETSTNDMVLALANGAAGITLSSDQDRKLFRSALREICIELAQAIARDGEGASKLITVEVKGARTLEQAREAARMITTSPLVKSAVHGEDPNWGRILARLGQAGVDTESFGKLSLDLQGLRVFEAGHPLAFDRAAARELLKGDSVVISVDLKIGTQQATAWGCDLTKRYVEINTEYS